MDFRSLSTIEREKLTGALRGNAEQGLVLLMSRRDTSFIGCSDEMPTDEMISAVASVPCHY